MNSRSFALIWMGGLIFLATKFVHAGQEKTFDIDLLDGKLLGSKTLQVQRYDKVGLRIKSNESGELHVHAYRIEIPVNTEMVSEYFFVAKASGKFRIEWHPTQQVRSNFEHRHQEPLAFLEVYPQ